jgi:hypothetical protein
VGRLCGKIGEEMSFDFYIQKYMNFDKIPYHDLVSMFSYKTSPKEAGRIINNALNSGFLSYSKNYIPNEHYYKGSNLRPTVICCFFKVIDVIEWAQKERTLNPNFPLVFDNEFIEHQRKRVRMFSETAQKIPENTDKKSFFELTAVRIKKEATLKDIEVNIPLLIYAIAHCFDIEIYKDLSKPKATYNEGGKNGRYNYGTIKGYIENVVKKGEKGGADRSMTTKYKLLLKELVAGDNYGELRGEFMIAQKLWST